MKFQFSSVFCLLLVLTSDGKKQQITRYNFSYIMLILYLFCPYRVRKIHQNLNYYYLRCLSCTQFASSIHKYDGSCIVLLNAYLFILILVMLFLVRYDATEERLLTDVSQPLKILKRRYYSTNVIHAFATPFMFVYFYPCPFFFL